MGVNIWLGLRLTNKSARFGLLCACTRFDGPELGRGLKIGCFSFSISMTFFSDRSFYEFYGWRQRKEKQSKGKQFHSINGFLSLVELELVLRLTNEIRKGIYVFILMWENLVTNSTSTRDLLLFIIRDLLNWLKIYDTIKISQSWVSQILTLFPDIPSHPLLVSGYYLSRPTPHHACIGSWRHLSEADDSKAKLLCPHTNGGQGEHDCGPDLHSWLAATSMVRRRYWYTLGIFLVSAFCMGCKFSWNWHTS